MHITSVCVSVCVALHTYTCLSRIMHCLVNCVLEYWSDAQYIKALNSTYVRLIYNARNHGEILRRLGRHTLTFRRKYHLVIIARRLMTETAPQHLLDICFLGDHYHIHCVSQYQSVRTCIARIALFQDPS